VNPYRPPAATLADVGDATQPVRVLSVSGRIGRARYVAYGLGFYVFSSLIGGVLVVLFGQFGLTVTVLAWSALAVIGFMLTIQRCHDLDRSGWLSLLVLVPLVNLMFLIIPGTDGPNRFGPPTPPNRVGVLIAAWLLPALVVVGIAAAIATGPTP